jgi:hypothetical protein
MPKQRNWLARLCWSFLLIACVGALSGCVSRGRVVTPQSIASMTDEEFGDYLGRVGLWAQLGAAAAVKQGADPDKIVAYANALELVTDPGPDTLSSVAASSGLDSLVVQLVLVEANALLEARGGLPAGSRGVSLLAHVAVSAKLGAAAGQLERSAQ